MAKILIVDDEENIRSSLKSALDRRGHETVTAASYAEGNKYTTASFDVIFLDVMLEDGNGLELLEEILKRNRQQIVVMISGHADVDMAVRAIQAGAYDFIEKPLSLDRILVTIDNAVKTNILRAEAGRLASLAYGDFIGESPAIRSLQSDIARSAPKAKRFLILGENGTGKELVANMIHRLGRYSDGPFVAVNCAALPAELVESELFGHTKGAFTGAGKSRRGRFLEAHSGTIFLDEISEMPLDAQAKILRAIETSQITPVGADTPIAVDCNIIAASNRNLEQMAKEGTFRQDLYYRLNVVQFQLPPLRERKEDIPLLADYFLQRFARESGTTAKVLADDALKLIASYDFPGNIRELKNLMERIHIYSEHHTVTAVDIKPFLPQLQGKEIKTLKEAVLEFEREYIEQALSRNHGNMTETARQLGLERSHLYKKVKRYRTD